jgi:hypothetical protein
MALFDTLDEMGHLCPAGLTQPVVFDRLPDRAKFDAERPEQPQERRLHHCDDVRDSASEAHHHNRTNEPKGQGRRRRSSAAVRDSISMAVP